MKQVTLIAALFISVSSFAQAKAINSDGSTPTSGSKVTSASGDVAYVNQLVKKDTAYVPLFEKTDTVKAHLIYVADNNAVMYMEGYAIVKGFAKQDKSWAEQPKITGYLDSKKKPKIKVLQAF